MTVEYLPWWLGGLCIATVAVAYFYIMNIPCGVSGIIGKVLNWSDEKKARDIEIKMAENADSVQEEMMAMAMAELENLPEIERKEIEAELRQAQEVEQLEQTASQQAPIAIERAHPIEHFLFILAIIVGGFLAVRKEFVFQYDMGETYANLFGSGMEAWTIMLFGGILVGFGTQMTGGCTMGHGISGNSCFQVGSILSTIVFFLTGIVISLLLKAFLL